MLENKDLLELGKLFIELIEGSITNERLAVLDKWLQHSPEALDYYCDFMKNAAILGHRADIYSNDLEGDSGQAFLEYLAEYEKTAPKIEIPEEGPQRELIQKVVYAPQEKRKVSKFQIATFIMSAAAVLFLVLFIKLAPEPSSIQVATVIDQVGTVWGREGIIPENGDRLWTLDTSLELKKGIVKLRYDEGVDVLVEGPAVFEIEESGIYLEYGRLYSCVSRSGMGFTVETPVTRFVDLGTEFGVQSNVNGSAELHVIKGKVQLFADLSNGSKTSQLVTENKAVRYDPNRGVVKDITIEEEAFVRAIDSASGIVWRGQTELSLASIFTGNDVFQEVSSFIGLNPVDGKYTTSLSSKRRKTTAQYKLVTDSGCIDGVFVPDGGLGAIQITSEGHTFDCPDTSGYITFGIAAFEGPVDGLNARIPPVLIDGEEVINDPVIAFHSNAGITFDLRSIRDSLMQLNLKGFRALGASLDNNKHDLEFFILVDGQIKYEKRFVTGSQPLSFNIELKPENRFLTLIVTDGDQSFFNDHFYLVDPKLIVSE